jgi:hypothetical protein
MGRRDAAPPRIFTISDSHASLITRGLRRRGMSIPFVSPDEGAERRQALVRIAAP